MPPPQALPQHLQPLLASDIEDEKHAASAPYEHSTIKRTSAQCKLTLLASLLALLVFLGWTYTQEGDGLNRYSYSHSHSSPSGGRAPITPTPGVILGTPPSSEDEAHILKQCPHSSPSPPKLPVEHNPWLPLSPSETSQIQSWLESTKELGLNLTKASEGKVNDNVVYNIELAVPGKGEVVEYLDGNGADGRNGVRREKGVERYARVTIHHGGVEEPHVKDYRVGPLPISKDTKLESMMHIYHTPTIPFNARGLGDLAEAFSFMEKLVEPIAPAMKDLFGGNTPTDPGDPLPLGDTFQAGPTGPWSFDGSFRRIWITWRYNVAGSFILPINFYNYVDMSGTDESKWRILRIVYHNQTFTSPDAFLEAYNNGTLVRFPRPSLEPEAWDWASRIRPYSLNTTTVSEDDDSVEPAGGDPVYSKKGSKEKHGKKGKDNRRIQAPTRDLDDLPGPRQVSFAGKRFRVHEQQRHVTWMGWSFYTGFDRDMGVNLWDVRFRGERVVYQLAPQEAIAQYAGADPVQSTTAWLDRFFGMGVLVRNLIPHYDCPSEAVFLGAETWHANLGKPLTRHTGDNLNEMGATKGYDYLFDYTFQLDGTIEVRLSASGYLQGAYWMESQRNYGHRIREFSMGSLHDHVINFKVDLDVAGTNNSVLKTSMKQQEIKLPFFSSEDEEGFDDWGNTVTQQVVTRSYLKTEEESRVDYFKNFEGGYAIVNTDELNRWGNPRGYAVHPGMSPVRNTVVGSKRLLNNANWAKYNLAVTQRKDEEPSSSCQWNLQLGGAPAVNFENFFNNESILQHDLVLWVNLGMHHLPQAEDSPNTKTNVATSSFLLTPLNYFDSDPSLDSLNSVLLNTPTEPGAGGRAEWEVEDYGVKQDFNCIPQGVDKVKYEGERVVFAAGKDEEEVSVDAILAGPEEVKERVKGLLYPLKIRTGI
ncbi:amine oxidase catalytic domain-containing protein [Coprinopsis sp. MPI-PUGE-AT-0042]|nr:amine oxidase catalytic domain-containing protein [Coprinopsis sp. MPI-PUGE-AT-0042]